MKTESNKDKDTRNLYLLSIKDYDALYEENIGLIYKSISKKSNLNIEVDDMISCGNIAFLKCVKHFDPSKGFPWSSYLMAAISNEILMLYRKQRRFQGKEVSYEEVITVDGSGEPLRIIDVISNTTQDDTLDGVYTQEVMNAVDRLPIVHRCIIYMVAKGLSQRQIGELLELGQPMVSRHTTRSRNLLRLSLNGTVLNKHLTKTEKSWQQVEDGIELTDSEHVNRDIQRVLLAKKWLSENPTLLL